MSKLAEDLDSLVTPFTERLTPEMAKLVLALAPAPKLQDRLEELADRCTEGQLTAEERSEYETYVTGLNYWAILQSKARRHPARSRMSP